MARIFWGSCCALLMIAFYMATPWRPAGADDTNPLGDNNGHATVDSPAGDPEPHPLPEIAAERRINKILDSQLIAPLEYAETPLTDILNIVQDDYDFPIVIDVSALDAVGISEDTEISVNLRSLTLRAALELMLRQVEELTFTIDNQVLLITTEEAEAEHLEIHIYRVDDLLDPDQQFNGADTEEIYRPLIMVLTNTVERDSWVKNGTGEGEIQLLRPGMLIVMQTLRVHRQIVRLLADIRQTRRQIDTTQDRQAASVQPITRGFELVVELGENPDDAQEQIAAAVMGSVDWDRARSALSEKDTWLKVLPERMLVRHLPSVVRQVERVALDMKLIKKKPRRHEGGGVGGFGGGGGGFSVGGGYGGGFGGGGQF